jgi:hypothetical protein
MNRTCLGFSAMLLLTAAIAAIAISCGGMTNPGANPSRMLQSISIRPSTVSTTADGQVQFIATGAFSAPPLMVSPLPVNWSGSWSVVPLYCFSTGCAGMNPDGMAVCFGDSPGVTITASAPSDPKLPLGTKNAPMVSGTAILNCD